MLSEASVVDEARRVLRQGFASYEAFCGLLSIIPKDGVRRRLRLNAIQRVYCQNRTPRDVILKARQVGMTTEEQARDVWHFLTHPGARVTVMCQSIADQESPARVLARNFNVMFDSLRALGLGLNFGKSPLGVWTLPEKDAVLRIVEAGASLAAAQKKGRAGTITRLHITEQAFWEYAAETLNAVEECVPSPDLGTEIVKESTPNGVGGKFYDDVQAAKNGTNGFRLHFYPWFFEPQYQLALEPGETATPASDREEQLVVSGCTPEQLKWFRRKVADKGSLDLVDQEYPSDPETCFLLSGRTFFSVEKIAELVRACVGVAPLETKPYRGDGANGELRIWQTPRRDSKYVLSLDPSEGTGGDPAAGIIREYGTGAHCATIHGQFKPYALARVAVDIAKRFGEPTIAVERNNHGHAVLQALAREHHYPRIFKHYDGKPGWLNTEVTRTKALSDLDDDMRAGTWTTKDVAVLSEMRTFVTTPEGRVEAARGSHDDLVLAEAIALDTIKKPPATRVDSGGGWS